MKRFLLAVLSAVLLFLLLPAPSYALGIAVAPATMEFTDTLRGVEYERSLTIFNPSQPECKYNLRAEGEAAKWLSFFAADTGNPVQQILIPAQNCAYVVVKVNIPPDIANGNYLATIYAETVPTAIPGGGGVSTLMQGRSEVSIGVTGGQIIEGTVNTISANDTEAGMPMRLVVNFTNSGNVTVQPKINCLIYKGTGKVAEFTDDTTSVKPQSQENIQTEWATTVDQTGDYTGQATVSLGDKVLVTQDLAFKILPPGTFSKQGELTSLNYLGQPLLDTTIKIQAGFKNTGEGDVMAKLIAEVYFNGNLIDTSNSEDTLIPVRQTGNIISYLKLSKTGNYTIKGYISYSGKQTEIKEIAINVPKGSSSASQTNGSGKVSDLIYPIVGGVVLIGILTGIVIVWRKSRKLNSRKVL